MVEQYARMLKEAGLRVTAARVAVLRELHNSPHSDADQVREAVKASLGSISGQAVYDALNSMTDNGLLRRVEPAGARARYEHLPHDNHHHIVCRTCGEMKDVPCDHGQSPCVVSPSLPAQWSLEQAELIYWGICPQCAQAKDVPADTVPSAVRQMPAA